MLLDDTWQPVTGAAAKMPPFDKNAYVLNGDGEVVRYLVDPLAETYLVAPGQTVEPGMLPPEEWQVRAAFIEMREFTQRFAGMGLLARLRRRAEYERARALAIEKQDALFNLVNSTPAHKAAMRRIVTTLRARDALEVFARYVE